MKWRGQRQSQNIKDLRIQDPIVRMQQSLSESEQNLKKTQRDKAETKKILNDITSNWKASKKQDRLKPTKR